MTLKSTTSKTTKSIIKDIMIHEGSFVDDESGEEIDLADYFSKVFGAEVPFTISATLKEDEELDI